MKLKLIKKTKETPTVIVFRFKPEQNVSFKPGQWMMLYGSGMKRAYSISSEPSENFLEFTIRIYEHDSSFSSYLNKLKAGDEIEAKGPFGMFLLEEKAKSIVFIAGGTGIAPLMSMIRHIARNNLPIKMALLFSCKTKNDIIHHEELERLEKRDKIKLVCTLTEEEPGEWTGHTGRIDEKMMRKNISDTKDTFYYICGPVEMINDMAETLLKVGVDRKRIKFEKWGSTKS